MQAVKKVAANSHRKKMPMAAYAQKLDKAGIADEEDMANATRSVMDVTVIDAPERANERAQRLARLSLSSEARAVCRSRSKALTGECGTGI